MAGLNLCQFIGNLGRDPEVKHTQSGKAVCKFSIAVSTGYGDKKTTEWVNVVCWEKTADAVGKYCLKGSPVYVSGRMSTRKWEKDGEVKYITEVVASEVQFLSGGKGEQRQKQRPEKQEPDHGMTYPVGNGDDGDDIPF